MFTPSSGLKYVNSGMRLVIQESYKESGPTVLQPEAGCGMFI
jgi:hypothetical protein